MPHYYENYMVNKDPEHRLKDITCFALDMDGTIYLDDVWVDGALEFLQKITETGRSYCFMTNNSSKSAAAYLQKLRGMGLDVSPQQLVTSGHATIAYLQAHHAGARVYLLGNDVLAAEFTAAGIALVQTSPDVVVSAFDTSFDYAKLCKFCDFVRAGVPYLATHPDYNCPTKTGFVPDIGAIHAYVQASTGRMPDKIIGKPNKEIIEYTLAQLGAQPYQTAVVGDRLYTDVKAGVSNGLCGIFVLSGEAQLCDLPTSDVQPHLIFTSVKEMIPFL